MGKGYGLRRKDGKKRAGRRRGKAVETQTVKESKKQEPFRSRKAGREGEQAK